ncbi:MAG TPA: hypothetical protein VH206_17530 [Xanthobacteraceae bacterium]|jgi:hypothetical protein|nr:hypothetical protein [Xanthobacteraceae bacterium]
MAEEPNLPLEPEAPEIVVWIRWLLHYVRYEGAVIRQAPLAFCIGVLALGGLVFFGLQWHHAGTDATKDATLENQRSHIAILEEELKGTQPQQGAVQRADIRTKLQSFYVEGGHLIRDIRAGPAQLPDKETDAIIQWVEQTAAWIEANMGTAAKDRFMDPGRDWFGSWSTFKTEDRFTIIRISTVFRANLVDLIENPAWDKLGNK